MKLDYKYWTDIYIYILFCNFIKTKPNWSYTLKKTSLWTVKHKFLIKATGRFKEKVTKKDKGFRAWLYLYNGNS